MIAHAQKSCVIAPVNFTDESFEAVKMALGMVSSPADVRVVHVVPAEEPDEFESVWTPPTPESRTEEARRRLAGELAKKALHGVTVDVRFGHAASEIAAAANSNGADLVVIPAPERHGLKRWFTEATAEEVVRLCHCPVLVLRK